MSLANRMAIASPLVSSRSVEAGEFPALSQRFGVQGVPRTVVNEQGAFAGAMPESRYVETILQLAGVPGMEDEAGPDGSPDGDAEAGDRA